MDMAWQKMGKAFGRGDGGEDGARLERLDNAVEGEQPKNERGLTPILAAREKGRNILVP